MCGPCCYSWTITLQALSINAVYTESTSGLKVTGYFFPKRCENKNQQYLDLHLGEITENAWENPEFLGGEELAKNYY